ncbi:MAG: hypothetical protein HFH87_01800 [Lachnospiraceae bacterium]|nr:hypothetical protein [Lachnospiraceae bacterium]
MVYVIGTFIAPVLVIGGAKLSFDVWCFPILLILYLIKKGKIVFHLEDIFFVPYFAFYICITLFTAAIYNCGISIATIYAIFRFISILNIIKDTWKGELSDFLDRVLACVIPLNVICCVVQMTNAVSVKLFYELYYKVSQSSLLNQIQIGYFNRAYGTTGSPVILGGISAMAYAYYLATYVSPRHNIRWNLLKLFCSIICGILALSKTAILAIPIMTFLILILNFAYNGNKSIMVLLRFLGIIVLGSAVLYFVIIWMKDEGFAIAYYLDFLKNPLKAFRTRYDSQSGNLSVAIDIIKNNLLFGVGHAIFNDNFVGDSAYIVLLYQTGILGFIAYLYPYMKNFIRGMKKKELLKSSLILVFFLIIAGNALHLAYYLIPFAAVIFDNYSNKVIDKK